MYIKEVPIGLHLNIKTKLCFEHNIINKYDAG